jgi:1-phosphatidylinositol-3-phosphate 5-kinase
MKELEAASSATAIRLERSEPFMASEELNHSSERGSHWGLVDLAEGAATDIEDAIKRQTVAQHFRLQFEEGSCRFSAKVFFAEQFDVLRRKCGVEEAFIESMARCVKWEVAGGKSGSAFLKTSDDRFIVKEMSRMEMDAFLHFAPAYFDYMSRAFFHGLPTLLAKIFGFFRIGFTANGKSSRMDVLVMENLFYERNVTKIYDLKGSKRNRHVTTTGRRGEVLLDENLTESASTSSSTGLRADSSILVAYKSPLFVREQSKKLLRMSLFNDTLFLEKLNVMDYSLVVGVDETTNELVVGIVGE